MPVLRVLKRCRVSFAIETQGRGNAERPKEGEMATTIFLAPCAVGEGFLLYALVQFVREGLRKQQPSANINIQSGRRALSEPLEFPLVSSKRATRAAVPFRSVS